MVTVTVAVFDYLFMGAKFSDNTIMALLCTMVGMSIYAGADINYNPWGYFWLLLNSLATGEQLHSEKLHSCFYS
jgi:drug/metabolite transporter (DMT)-like permease